MLCSLPHSLLPKDRFYFALVVQSLIKPNTLMMSNYSKGSHARYLCGHGLRHKAPSAPGRRAHPSSVQWLETHPSKEATQGSTPGLSTETLGTGVTSEHRSSTAADPALPAHRCAGCSS